MTTTYSYDAWGNLTTTTYSDGTPSVMLGYDALGRQKRVTDAAGTTTFTYDDHGDEAQVEVTGLYSKTLVRHRDAFGRDLGHTVDGTRKNVIEYDSATGRICREQLGAAWYVWSYLPGTSLKSSLSVGTAAITTWSYEPNRDLLAQVKNTVFGRIASQYDYANDALGRRTAISHSGTMMSETRNDAYGYNERSELTNAVKNVISSEYAYLYDDIGNRESSTEPSKSLAYVANQLNQYTQISTVNLNLQPQPFVPSYDADGNQTLVRTKTGIWSVTYNGENRPVSWTCGATNIVMTFDRMGRRFELIETVADSAESSMGSNTMEDSIVTNKHQRFVYDGYLCLQRLNGANNAITDLFEWDPTELVATRPLYWQARTSQGNFSLFYTHDGNKNVSEAVFYQRARGVAAHYEYAPFGEVTAQTRGDSWGSLDFASLNPWRFSSEHADDATATVYYNYRHYEPIMGRWLSRDPMPNDRGILYSYVDNNVIGRSDMLGLLEACPNGAKVKKEGSSCMFRTNKDKGGEKKTNGCGAEGGYKVPDSFFWIVSFEGCCNAHDVCYATCGRTKYKCDLGLGACMASRCMAKLWWSPFLMRLCVNQAEIYAAAVLGLGGDAFDAAQDENCEWKGCCCDE